jgi:predicted DNA-binding transcriptional regulator AlpA
MPSGEEDAVYDQQRDRLWGIKDVADFLGVPRKTLYQWRRDGYGPRGRRVGRYLRYDPSEVREWFTSLNDGMA